MKKQGYNDRLDESLGMRRGKESGKMQSYKDRRDESRGARRHESKKSSHPMKRGSSLFGVEDNKKSGKVYYVSTDGEQYDLDRIKKYNCGSKGYPSEAYK